jgi:hypothetical protein
VVKITTKGTPELEVAVSEGRVSINAAATVSELPHEEQRDLLKQGPQAVRDAATLVKHKNRVSGNGVAKQGGGVISIGPTMRKKMAAAVEELQRLVDKPSTQISIMDLRKKVSELREMFSQLS